MGTGIVAQSPSFGSSWMKMPPEIDHRLAEESSHHPSHLSA